MRPPVPKKAQLPSRPSHLTSFSPPAGLEGRLLELCRKTCPLQMTLLQTLDVQLQFAWCFPITGIVASPLGLQLANLEYSLQDRILVWSL